MPCSPNRSHLAGWLLGIYCLGLLGCATKNYNVANPVMGPPPPRIGNPGQVQLAQSEDDTGLQQVSYEPEVPLNDSTVVARVNGQPVLAGDLLEPYAGKLLEVREKAPPAEFRKIQDMLIQREMDKTVMSLLAADAVKSKLKKEQLESVEKQLDDGFDKFVVPKLKQSTGLATLAEVEALLQSQGSSLESIRRSFGASQMMDQYLGAKLGDEPKPSRAELLAKYQSQLDKYAQPTRVRWRLLQVSIAKHKSEAKAREVLETALAKHSAGQDFGDLVKQISDGPNTENGGQHDWTQPSSAASPEIRKALTELRAGQCSDILKTNGTLNVVLVEERREAGHTPFDEVQLEIRKQIISEWKEARSKAIFQELRDAAVIETIYDGSSSAKNAFIQ